MQLGALTKRKERGKEGRKDGRERREFLQKGIWKNGLSNKTPIFDFSRPHSTYEYKIFIPWPLIRLMKRSARPITEGC